VSRGLGGPGEACSAIRIRQLDAGELEGEARARAAEHLAHCGRCQATASEVARERAEVLRALPFEALAAGVAERLAAAPARVRAARWRALPLALAAALAVAGAAPLVLRVMDAGPAVRTKGAPALTVYVRAPGGAARPLAPGEPVPRGAALRVGVDPAGRREVAVALLDADGAAVIYDGPAASGLLPGAFEWTGRAGTLVLVLDDVPVDRAALARRLASGGAAAASPGGRAEVVALPLVVEGARGR
jgi:hypothetical protein